MQVVSTTCFFSLIKDIPDHQDNNPGQYRINTNKSQNQHSKVLGSDGNYL